MVIECVFLFRDCGVFVECQMWLEIDINMFWMLFQYFEAVSLRLFEHVLSHSRTFEGRSHLV